MFHKKNLVISLPAQAGLPLKVSDMARGMVFAVVSVISFFAPFTLGHPQWLVGTVVNACLFLGAIYLPKRSYIPLAILPSLGVLARGLVFGPATMFLVYFLPIIWMGNLILIFMFRAIYSNVLKNNRIVFFLAMAGAAVGKSGLLFVLAFIYFKLDILPVLFLQLMGLNQLATALIGGLVAFVIFKLIRKNNNDSRRRRIN